MSFLLSAMKVPGKYFVFVTILFIFGTTNAQSDEEYSYEDPNEYKRSYGEVSSQQKGYQNKGRNICTYNGRRYRIGDSIPTPDEPCMKCICFEGWTGPDPVHCAVVDCPWGVYERKGCTPKYTKGECCPDWQCSIREYTCQYNGKTYKLGESIPTPDKPCYLCTCTENWLGPSDGPCAVIDCPPTELYEPRGCTAKFTAGQCCPEWVCPEEKVTTPKFPYGQKDRYGQNNRYRKGPSYG